MWVIWVEREEKNFWRWDWTGGITTLSSSGQRPASTRRAVTAHGSRWTFVEERSVVSGKPAHIQEFHIAWPRRRSSLSLDRHASGSSGYYKACNIEHGRRAQFRPRHRRRGEEFSIVDQRNLFRHQVLGWRHGGGCGLRNRECQPRVPPGRAVGRIEFAIDFATDKTLQVAHREDIPDLRTDPENA
jgi:hypothetical protein